MKWVWWSVAVGAFLVMLYACALPGDLPAGRGDAGGLAGTYTVNGLDPNGVEYSGTVVITETARTDSYDVEWIITGSILRGTGERIGDEFVADWIAVAAAGGGSGRSSYVIETDGRLVGIREVDGFDAVGTEEIFPEP